MQVLLTLQELKQFDGSKGSIIYLAILGKVFDVSRSSATYGMHGSSVFPSSNGINQIFPAIVAIWLSQQALKHAVTCCKQCTCCNLCASCMLHALSVISGSNGPYSVFCGRDASRAFATGMTSNSEIKLVLKWALPGKICTCQTSHFF